jgi:putative SOS response-associated peptidase YedK
VAPYPPGQWLLRVDDSRKKKLPARFRLKSHEPFGFAGVWEIWNGPKGKAFSCAIVTTPPTELVREIHDRLPVILT